jgi:hypothetical protein
MITKGLEMKNNIYFRFFKKSLNKEQQLDYDQSSINKQKDWYISYLEDNFSISKGIQWCDYSNIMCPIPENKQCRTCKLR